jgi:tripartite-type tricarboxylate transporter receptor subunit TctC
MLGFVRAAVCLAIAVSTTSALAQNYPTGPVKLIVPIPAGGVTDVMARVIGQRLQEMWGQTVVVENRPGGNSGVGAQAVERAPPDGHTLLLLPRTRPLPRTPRCSPS